MTTTTKRILVTGSNGFVGKHLVRELRNQGHQVIGTGMQEAAPDIKDLLDRFVKCDLTNLESVSQIDFSSIDVVIHLAALANQGMSFDQPQKFIADNSGMVINLFETALAQKLATYPRFIIVSSSSVYESEQPMPLTEDSQTTHRTPYAISKLLGEMLCDYYRTRGIDSITIRPFNHTGPGQGPGYLLPDMVKQLSELGKDGVLKVGNTKSRRDFSDVRDVVKAYALLATTPEIKGNLYNICSGTSHSGEEIIELIAKALYGGDAKPRTEVDQARIRPNDPAEILGSSDRLRSDLGWKPVIPIGQTVRDYVDWYKETRPF